MACIDPINPYSGPCGDASDGYIDVVQFEAGLSCDETVWLYALDPSNPAFNESTFISEIRLGKAIPVGKELLFDLSTGAKTLGLRFDPNGPNDNTILGTDAEISVQGNETTFRWDAVQYATFGVRLLATDEEIDSEITLMSATVETRAGSPSGGGVWDMAIWDFYSAPTPFILAEDEDIFWGNGQAVRFRIEFNPANRQITVSAQGQSITGTIAWPDGFPPPSVLIPRAAVSDTSLYGVQMRNATINGVAIDDLTVAQGDTDRVQGALVRGFTTTEAWVIEYDQIVQWFTGTAPSNSQAAIQWRFGYPSCATTFVLAFNQDDTEGILDSCERPMYDIGLGAGSNHVIQTEWITAPTGEKARTPELWVFVKDKDPINLGTFDDGGTFRLSWDIRHSIEQGTVYFGLRFSTEEGNQLYWLFSNGLGAEVEFEADCIIINFVDFVAASGFNGNTFFEIIGVQDESAACAESGTEQAWRMRIFDCCFDCTKPYDNTVFCLEWHDETQFAYRDITNPGLAKQVFVSGPDGSAPTRAISVTRSADAFDEDMRLRYSSQKWVMVWDLELNRLIDFFPQQWLRHGAAAYFQHQTFRKEIKAGQSSRKPYYVEVVDLGLVFDVQGSYNMDKDEWGQRAENWDVPSKLIGLPKTHQQRPVGGWGGPDAMTTEALYAEFNQTSVHEFERTAEVAVTAQRERFFQDRNLFLDHQARQRFHDQFMFLIKEVAEKMLRDFDDMVEQSKHMVDSFNPEIPDTFAHFTTVILNAISQKLLRTKNDLTEGVFGNTSLENDEEALGDWARYAYGELRRMVELEKIDKKDVQLGILQGLTEVDPNDPGSALEAITNAIPIGALQQEYELAANARVPAGAGVTDPDTLEENRTRGLAK